MADMSMDGVRLLGFAPADDVVTLQAALATVVGPPLSLRHGPGLAAVLQHERTSPDARRLDAALLAGLGIVQRRLEAACQAGPFLPMDPAAACCEADLVDGLLNTAWDGLAEALAMHGARHQWDLVLRWAPEPVVRRRRAAIADAAAQGPDALSEGVAAALRQERVEREAMLRATLADAVLGLAERGGAVSEAEVHVTVLIPAGGEARVEAALALLPPACAEDASIDMRGPLPPLSFVNARLVSVDTASVTLAWQTLGLEDTCDALSLHQHWRRCAALTHPDRLPPGAGEAAGKAVSTATEAYHLLRDLSAGCGRRPWTLPSLLGHGDGGLRLLVSPPRRHAPSAAASPRLEPVS